MITKQYPKALTFALPPEHFEQIKQITDKQQISIAKWVRNAIAMALNKNKRVENRKT